MGGLLTLEKAPFIVASALTAMGWIVSSLVGYFASVPVVIYSDNSTPDRIEYRIHNASVKELTDRYYFRLQCADATNCLDKSHKIDVNAVPPYEFENNKLAEANPSYVNFITALPPSGSIDVVVSPRPAVGMQLMFRGQKPLIANSSELSVQPATPTAAVILQSGAPLAILMTYYSEFIAVSIILLLMTLAYALICLAAKPSSSSPPDKAPPKG